MRSAVDGRQGWLSLELVLFCIFSRVNNLFVGDTQS